MPRMNKSVILGLLVATSTVFLLFQLYYYRQYSYKPGSHFLGRTGHLSSNDVAWNTVKKFLSLAQHFNLPVFLADVASLALVSQDQPPQQQEGQRRIEPHCTFLCTGRPITSFGLLANLWKYDPSLLVLAEERGFDVLEVRGEDPRLASMDDLSANQIPLHFLFRHRGYVVQVTLLYERSGNYLWHGALRLKASADRTFAPFRMLDYGRHAGAYDRPALVLTTLDGLDVRIPRNVSHFLSERRSARYVECRHREARDFYRLYPDDGGQEAIEFRRRAKSLLHLSAKTLNDLSIPFWLSSGTCLGWLRQCDIITWSRDVDLGVFARDYRPEIVTAMARAGLPLKHKFGKVGDSLELSFQGQEVKLDVFFYYEDGDIIWNGGTQARTGRKFKYVFPHFLLCWTELLELRVRVPCEAHTVMEANYGPGWQSPVHTWDWKTSPSNVRDNGRWPPAEWDEVVQVY